MTLRASAALQSVLALLSALLASAWCLYFVDLVPLAEVRDWLTWGEAPEIVADVANNLVWRRTTYSRDLSLGYTLAVGKACGQRVQCVNLLLAVPLALAGALLFVLGRCVLGRRSLALFVVALWAASLPVLATSAWQATVLDRVGIVAALAMLWAGVTWSRESTAKTSRSVALRGFAYLAGTFACLNSKEAYWLIPLATVAAHCWLYPPAMSREPDARRLRDAAWLFGPAALYAAWFAASYLRAVPFSGDWVAHTRSGSIGKNIGAAMTSIAGDPAIALAILCVALLGLGWSRARAQGQSWRVLVWLAGSTLLAWLPTAATRSPADYYQLLPSALSYLLIALVATRLWSVRKLRVLAAAVVVLALTGVVIAQRSDVAEMYRFRSTLSDRWLQAGRALWATSPDLANDVLRSGALCVDVAPELPDARQIFEAGSPLSLLRWSAPSSLPRPLMNIPVKTGLQPPCVLLTISAEGTLTTSLHPAGEKP